MRFKVCVKTVSVLAAVAALSLAAAGCLSGGSPASSSTSSFTAPSRPPWLRIYTDVVFSGPSLGLVSGWHGTILRSTDGGQIWNDAQVPSTADLNSVAILDPNTAVAVGASGNILRSTDAGRTWVKVESPTDETLNAVAAISSSAVVAAGGHGTIIGSSDGGRTWTSRFNNQEPSLNFEAVAFTADGTGMAVSSSGAVYKTTDSISWRPLTLPDSGQKLFAVDLLDDSNAVVAGKVGADPTLVTGGKTVILRTGSSGKDWAYASRNLNVDLLSIKLLDPQNIIAAGWDGVILRTQDGGATWTSTISQTGEAIRSLAVMDASTIFAVGDGQTIVESRNGGFTWEKIRGF